MAIVDNNILSSLAKIQRLDLLNQVFDTVSTIPSIIEELHHDQVTGADFVQRIDDRKQYNDGWIEITPLQPETLELAEEIVDHSVSLTDAECIAAAEHNDEILVTDDAHVGETAMQRDIRVWDLKLLLQACRHQTILTENETSEIITQLENRDGYLFSEEDRDDLLS